MNVLPASETRLRGRFLWPARIAWVLILALIVSMLVVNAPANVVYARLEYQIQQARWAILSITSLQTFAGWLVAVRWLIVTIYFAVALLIAWRKWNDWFALFVSAALLLLAWGFVMRSDHNTWLYPRLLQVVPATPFILAQLPLLGLVLLFFLFPDGRFVPRWHKWLALPPVLATALFFYGDENRLVWRDYRPFLEQWAWPIWATLLLVSLLMALAGQVYRYRRVAMPAQRQQMKWVLFGLAAILSIPLLSWPLEDAAGAWGALAAIGLELAATTFLPITIGFSILRYRLWDIDLLINRTLVFGGLTLLVAAVYALLVGFLSGLFRAGNNLLLSILATGLIAVLFDPLRRRLQQGVNRLMYGERDDPVAVLARLGERLENSAIPEDVLPVLVETIGQTLKLPYVAVAIKRDDELVTVAAYPEKGDDLRSLTWQGDKMSQQGNFTLSSPYLVTLALNYQSEWVGQLLVAPRAPGEIFSAPEQRLLAQTAHQAAGVVHTFRLNQDLQRARERLVAAREEERRQIRRALHDGLGAQLASMTLKADTTCRQLTGSPEMAAALLQELRADTQQAMHDIRALTRSLSTAADEESP